MKQGRQVNVVVNDYSTGVVALMVHEGKAAPVVQQRSLWLLLFLTCWCRLEKLQVLACSASWSKRLPV